MIITTEKAGNEYAVGTRMNIRNDRPIIGLYNVNNSGSGDMYSKGGNMLHTLRQIINNDEKWRDILRGLNHEFYHQTVTTRQIENYISDKTGRNLSSFLTSISEITESLFLSIQLKKMNYHFAGVTVYGNLICR